MLYDYVSVKIWKLAVPGICNYHIGSGTSYPIFLKKCCDYREGVFYTRSVNSDPPSHVGTFLGFLKAGASVNGDYSDSELMYIAYTIITATHLLSNQYL